MYTQDKETLTRLQQMDQQLYETAVAHGRMVQAGAINRRMVSRNQKLRKLERQAEK